MTVWTPRDARDVEAAVRQALADRTALEVAGQGTKREIGRPARADATLDLSALSGVTLYEPEELVLSARAGTPLAEIEALVAAQRQQLSFEPMDCGPILHGSPGAGTIGGALATNLAGPRRVKVGAARDHFLGVTAVSGRAETFKSGGRVVKNVTGYDLCKLLAGSFGTLAVMTDVTIKTLPRPETEASVLILGLTPDAAVGVMAAAMGSSCDVSGAAHLPASGAAALETVSAGAAITALRLEGFAPSIAHRQQALLALTHNVGACLVLEEGPSRALWRSVRDVAPFRAGDGAEGRPLWRISTAPSKGAMLGRLIAAQQEAEVIYDWAGGLLWVLPPPSDDAGAAVIRAAVRACGGHATLIRAPTTLRAALDVFEPQDTAVAMLTKRIKEGFDPAGILNPGRMWAGV